MPMPEPDEHHAKLATLAGRFVAEETLYPSAWNPEECTATGYFDSKMVLGGFFLMNDYVQRRDGAVTFEGHGLYGWDDARGAYTMHWFDSMGGDPGAPVLGAWRGDTLTFAKSGPEGHARYTYVLETADVLVFSISTSKNGDTWQTLLEGRFLRQA